MLNVQGLSVQFGGKFLFDDISFVIKNRDRVGLAGRNGAGKSTLLKVINRLEEAEKGSVVRPPGYTIGYLSQDISRMHGKTVYEEAASAFAELRQLEQDVLDIEKQLETRGDYESDEYMKLVELLSAKQERLDLLGQNTAEKELELVLKGLGFDREELDNAVETFSGGWQMRIELAKILLSRPDLILLDEPTNHLDIESIQWLEGFLKSYHGAIFVVSHDRAFLDNVTNRTIEISNGKLYDYKAAYTKYLELREERRLAQVIAAKAQEKEIEQTKILINKFRAKKNKAKFAQTLIRKLEKMEIIEVDSEDKSGIKFTFPPAPRSGKVVLDASDLSKSYGDLEVLKKIQFQILRGEKIAFVGKNGMGKSTLSKIITGEESFEGHFELGHNVEIGYFAQDQAETLDGENSVFQLIDNAATGDMRSRVRSLLGAFLFSGSDQEKKVKVLSGGEKSRLAMAKLLLEPVNLLVLDEPTNHLDIRSKSVLKQSLKNFDGSLIVVSHDRDFLKGLTDRVFEFKDGQIKEHIGDVYTFLKSKKLSTLSEFERSNEGNKAGGKNKKGGASNGQSSGGNTGTDSSGSALSSAEAQELANMSNKEWYNSKKEVEKEERKFRKDVDRQEKLIAKLEAEAAVIESKLKDPEVFTTLEPNDPLYSEYENLKTQLEAALASWESAGAAYEKASARRKLLAQRK